MAGSSPRPLLAAALFFCAAVALPSGTRPLQAQTLPGGVSSQQAQDLLRAQPDLLNRLRQQVGSSGMSPQQIRDRLRAAGYPEGLLDAYLPGSTTADATLDADVFSAVRELGIADSTQLSTLTGGISDDPRFRRPTAADTVFDVRAIRGLERRPEQRAIDERLARELARDRADADTGIARVNRPPAGLPTDSLALQEALVDSGFVIFGADVFRRGSTEFDPNLAGPVDENYRLGPGDRLVLILTGDVEQSYALDVTREGFVVIPSVGQLYVNDLTLGQLEDVLYQRLGRAYSGISRGAGATTRFSVSVSRLRTNQVSVTGDVAQPGSYRVSATGTALSALYAAGGPTANGSLRRIVVRRGGRVVDSLDLYDYLLRGDPGRDVRLQSGDVVFVPVAGARVRVVGEVVRPATYEMREGETLDDLLRAAGGLLPGASRSRVQIERFLVPTASVAGGRVVLDVTPSGAPGAAPPVPIQAGDVVRVFPVAERVRNRIAVRGNVWTPGTFGLTPGMTLSQALRQAGGLRPDSYLGQVLVTRLRDDSSRVQLRAALRDTTGAAVEDLALEEDDEIRVFSISEFRPTRYVAITGAVRRGGQYPYRDGMTVRDLVLLAGGLREGAYLREAEVARLPEDRSRGATATTFRAPMDSTFLFERAPDGRYLGPPGLPAPAASAPDVLLRPYDNVLILQQPDWEFQRTVVLTGEVRFPGRYAITNKNERLTDVIQRAGGLTTEAYAEGIEFHRVGTGIGRIGVDLPRALRDPRHRDNLLLVDQDSINIPVFSAVVYVAGAVNSPVAVAYVPGRDLSYYIDAAGGPTRTADTRRAFVTQPNGKVESAPSRVFFDFRSPKPRPGSRVQVPERDPTERAQFIATTTAIVQILASLVTVVAVLTN